METIHVLKRLTNVSGFPEVQAVSAVSGVTTVRLYTDIDVVDISIDDAHMDTIVAEACSLWIPSEFVVGAVTRGVCINRRCQSKCRN